MCTITMVDSFDPAFPYELNSHISAHHDEWETPPTSNFHSNLSDILKRETCLGFQTSLLLFGDKYIQISLGFGKGLNAHQTQASFQ